MLPLIEVGVFYFVRKAILHTKKREKTALSHLPPWGKTSEAESPAPIRKGRPARLIAGRACTKEKK